MVNACFNSNFRFYFNYKVWNPLEANVKVFSNVFIILDRLFYLIEQSTNATLRINMLAIY